MDQMMTVQELADYLQVTVKTIYRLLERGVIPANRVGHLWRFDRNAIDAWLRQSTKPATVRILVIDDDEIIGTLFEAALEDTGHLVKAVQNPDEGLELFKSGDYDMVFLDLIMPGMDGAAVFKQIRAINPDMPVTIVTGFPDSDLMMSALDSGPFSVMKKPFTSSEIKTAINNYLRFGTTLRY